MSALFVTQLRPNNALPLNQAIEFEGVIYMHPTSLYRLVLRFDPDQPKPEPLYPRHGNSDWLAVAHG